MTICWSGAHTAARAIKLWETYAVIQGHGVIQAQGAAKDHVLVCDPIAARVCVDTNGPCCHQVPCGYLVSGPCWSLMAMLQSGQYRSE